MAPLTVSVGDNDVTFTDPSKARAAATRWTRMARELDTADAPPEATLRAHELRTRAKAAQDWARREEATLPAEPSATSPLAQKLSPAERIFGLMPNVSPALRGFDRGEDGRFFDCRRCRFVGGNRHYSGSARSRRGQFFRLLFGE